MCRPRSTEGPPRPASTIAPSARPLVLRGDHTMQKRTILRAAASAVGGALLVTACSSGGGTGQPQSNSQISVQPVAGSGASNGDAPDACALVTTADASALFGQPASDGVTTTNGGGCAWSAVGNLTDGTKLHYSLVAHAYNGTSAYNEPKIPG